MPQDLPPIGGYDAVQYKVESLRLLGPIREAVTLTELFSAAKHPGPRPATRLVPRRRRCGDGIWMEETLPGQSRKEVRIYNDSFNVCLSTSGPRSSRLHQVLQKRYLPSALTLFVDDNNNGGFLATLLIAPLLHPR